MNSRYTPDLRSIALGLVARLLPAARGSQTASLEEDYLRNMANLLREAGGDDPDGTGLLELILRIEAAPDGLDRMPLLAARKLSLHPAELLTVALCLAVEEDPWAGRVLAYLQQPVGGGRPTLGLLEVAFRPLACRGGGVHGESGEIPRVTAIIAGGRGVASGLLLRLNEGAPLPEQAVSVPLALSMLFSGISSGWPGELPSGEDEIPLPPSLAAMARQHGISLSSERRRMLVVRTPSLREGAAVAHSVAGAIGCRALLLDGERLETAGLGIYCLAGKLVPVFCYDLGPGEKRTVPRLEGYGGPLLAIAGPDGSVVSRLDHCLQWHLPLPGQDERAELWGWHLKDPLLAASLAQAHLHGAGRIAELAAVARHSAQVRGATMPDLSDIRHASWGGEGGGLAGLARPITDRICDDALVLPQSLREELELLLQRCRQRETLAKGLGVTMAARYRLGVRSLFVGASGTGKTLAAAWLATRLGTPLYCVDLSAVTSKYIGETEKNLATLLARAEHEDVMLLFDEADSLFGKRTDIRDANDRFANAQTNYLLQRIEEYRGIVILTSNTRNRFDAAFTRRIDMIVDFPMPGPEERRDIWLSHLGAGHGISAGEVNRISAGADLCGGHIRNVVLTAAVLASRESRTITYGDILAGMQVEYRKLGRQLPAELSRNP